LRKKTLFDYTSLNLRLPKSLLEDVKRFARIDGRSDNAEMVMAISEYFKARKLYREQGTEKTNEPKETK